MCLDQAKQFFPLYCQQDQLLQRQDKTMHVVQTLLNGDL